MEEKLEFKCECGQSLTRNDMEQIRVREGQVVGVCPVCDRDVPMPGVNVEDVRPSKPAPAVEPAPHRRRGRETESAVEPAPEE